jgi:hypothetical protein
MGLCTSYCLKPNIFRAWILSDMDVNEVINTCTELNSGCPQYIYGRRLVRCYRYEKQNISDVQL